MDQNNISHNLRGDPKHLATYCPHTGQATAKGITMVISITMAKPIGGLYPQIKNAIGGLVLLCNNSAGAEKAYSLCSAAF